MNRSVTISIILAVVAILWVSSGALSSDAPDENTNTETLSDKNAVEAQSDQGSAANEAFKVQVKHISAVPMNDLIELQGDIHAAREIDIKAETQGTVAKLHAQKGAQLKRGAPILTIAINDRLARLEQAKAELKVREADLASGLKLKQKNLISQNQHEQNIANVEAAKAAVKRIQVEISQTKVQAAFDGILDQLQVEQGDYLSAGDPVAVLVDNAQVKIRAELPQQHLNKVQIGHKAEAELLDGTRIEGTINYISSAANPETRTFAIEATADNTQGIRHFGQSARVRLMLEERLAHKLSPSYLDLDSEGGLRVKGVDAQNRVNTYPVTILRNERDGVWLAGMPETLTLITVGQGFVSEGDQVSPVFEQSHSDQSAHNEATHRGATL